MKRMLVLFQMGSEVRQFGHSGFIEQVIDQGWEVLAATRFDPQEIAPQLDPRVQVLSLPVARPDPWYEQAAAALDKAQGLRRRRAGLTTWAYGRSNPKNYRQRLRLWLVDLLSRGMAAMPGLFGLVQRWEAARIRSGGKEQYADFLRLHHPDAVVVSVPRFNYQSHLLSEAEAMGIPSFLFFHTNKDIVALSRLDHRFTAIGVWNKWMQQNLLAQNPGLRQDTVHITGCAHFDCAGRADWLVPEGEFRREIGAGPDEKLVLYTAGGPGILPEEERFIDAVVEGLEAIPDYNTRLVVRLNPMDDSSRIEDHVKVHHPDVIVLRPDWHYARRQNLCYQRREDTRLLNNLLQYSAVCVNIPSTVTVECALAGLPVINIGFDLAGPKPAPGSVHAFWDVDYYENVRKSGSAWLCETTSSLTQALGACLANRDIMQAQQHQLIDIELNGIYPPQAHKNYVEVIERYLD